MAYNAFARYYDLFSADVDYINMADHLSGILKAHMQDCRLVLDLCCGTGSLALELSQLGYEVIGVDGSEDMLLIAQEKLAGNSPATPPIFLCQDMRGLDLYGTVDATVCTLDSLNHLGNEEDVRKVFERVALFTRPEGLFLFDVNTAYKHKEVLGDNCFVFEQDDIMCVWQNSLCPDTLKVDISLDFFSLTNSGLYERESEDFSECYYSVDTLRDMLIKTGFEPIGFWGEFTTTPPAPDCQRILCMARRT